MKKTTQQRVGPSSLKYDSNGLIPAVVQDANTKAVLMVAYMNKESLKRSIKIGKTCFWSRSRKTFWVKGETSGCTQKIKKIFYDCDMDCLLFEVVQKGVACHTGEYSCFYRRLK